MGRALIPKAFSTRSPKQASLKTTSPQALEGDVEAPGRRVCPMGTPSLYRVSEEVYYRVSRVY